MGLFFVSHYDLNLELTHLFDGSVNCVISGSSVSLAFLFDSDNLALPSFLLMATPATLWVSQRSSTKMQSSQLQEAHMEHLMAQLTGHLEHCCH